MKPLIASAFLLLGACSGNASEPAKGTAPAVPSPSSPTAPSRVAEPTPEQVPVPSDFAEEAKATINEASYKAELAVLAKEIESDP